MYAKPQPQAHRHRETTVHVPNLQRKSSNQECIRAEEHTLARFLAADPPNPFPTAPRAISPSQTLWPTVPQRIAQTRTPLASTPPAHRPGPTLLSTTLQTVRPKPAPHQQPFRWSLSQQPFEPSVRAKPRPTAPGTSPQASPSYQQPFRPSDRPPNPLTNAPPRHRPGAGEPHGATSYCACAIPSPSGAPTGQGPLPLCAQHHPSSIRS